MSLSNTPRTDSNCWDTIAGAARCNPSVEGCYVPTTVSRQLETELAESQQANGEAIKTIQRYIAELKAANEKADQWREMAEELANKSQHLAICYLHELSQSLAGKNCQKEFVAGTKARHAIQESLIKFNHMNSSAFSAVQ